MSNLEARLVAGLEAQGWVETASHGAWRRFGKFGRGAMYVRPAAVDFAVAAELWFSELCFTEPDFKVVGPIYIRVLEAGDKKLAEDRPDTEALLIELWDLKKP